MKGIFTAIAVVACATTSFAQSKQNEEVFAYKQIFEVSGKAESQYAEPCEYKIAIDVGAPVRASCMAVYAGVDVSLSFELQPGEVEGDFILTRNASFTRRFPMTATNDTPKNQYLGYETKTFVIHSGI
jgi:hypothetical protein